MSSRDLSPTHARNGQPWVWLCAVLFLVSTSQLARRAEADDGAVAIPKLAPMSGDSLDPLPAGSPAAPRDLRDFEGIWVALGRKASADGAPPPYRPEVLAEVQRLRDLDRRGTPVIARNTLCRPGTLVDVTINQFPTQILQRADKIIFIAEEGRSIWEVYLNRAHPTPLVSKRLGDNVGHWEGNTLIVDSAGFKPSTIDALGNGNSELLHVVTRIARANTGDTRNGDRLIITHWIDDPKFYSRPWTQVSIARWRPDLDMLEFDCEASPPSLATEGLAPE
jgi:hypothetical protein